MLDINLDLLQWSINFFNRKTSVRTATLASKSAIQNESVSNKELAEELHKPIIKTTKEKYTHF